MRKIGILEPRATVLLGLIVALGSGGVAAGPEAIADGYQEAAQSPATFAYLGLAGVFGGVLGTVVRVRWANAWTGAAVAAIAVTGTLLTGLSPLGDTRQFFITLIALGLVGLTGYLIVGFGRSGREGTREAARAGQSSDRGSGRGGFGRGDGRFGGGGASGNW